MTRIYHWAAVALWLAGSMAQGQYMTGSGGTEHMLYCDTRPAPSSAMYHTGNGGTEHMLDFESLPATSSAMYLSGIGGTEHMSYYDSMPPTETGMYVSGTGHPYGSGDLQPTAATGPYTEPWEVSLEGWVDRDAGEMEVSFAPAAGHPGGAMAGTFAEQTSAPVPELDAFRATADSSGGAFTGNYFEQYDEFYGWSFDFYAGDVLPSLLQVRFSGAGYVFFANVLSQVTSVGRWYTLTTPKNYAGWFGGTAEQWSNALASVEWVEVQVVRNGTGEQTYLLDNFSNNLPEIRRSAIGGRIWFDTNGNGIQEDGETFAIQNLPVALMNAESNFVLATTTTDDSGHYGFDELVASNYVVRFAISGEPALMPSPKHQGGDASLDSDAATNAAGETFAWTDLIALGLDATNLTVDLGLMSRDGTRAELAAVWGEWTEEGARVAWHTSSEWGTAGFYLYRVDPATGAEERLGDELIPSVFPEAGAVYEWTDPLAEEGGAGTYRLEEVELSGRVRDLGRHQVVFGVPPARAKAARSRVESAQAAKTKKTAAPQAVPQALGPSAILKVRSTQEGLQGVSLQAIANGLGYGAESVRVLAEEGSLALRCRGSLLPALYDAARDRLVFHVSLPTPDAHSRETVVMISVAPGAIMPRREPGASSGATVRPVRKRIEEDLNPGLAALPTLPDYDYYWNRLIGTASTIFGWKNFALDLSGHAGNDVTLKVRLIGWTRTSQVPDHRAEFRFNGTAVGFLEFDGQEVVTAELTIPAGLVADGPNTLGVKAVLLPNRSTSQFALDWIEAEFDRLVSPGIGTVHFMAVGASAISAAAFNEPLVVALDAANQPTWLANAEGVLPAKAWAAAEGDERYAVVEAADIPMLTPEAAASEAWFLSAENRVDYLIVAPRALAEAAQALADYRAGQGLRTGVAVFEDVCDLLADGACTLEAVRRLLALTAETWAEPPWMAVLAGSGHGDYLGRSGVKPSHLPPLRVQTRDGLCAADGLLADVDSDGQPDLALGRLPAQTPEDLAVMVAKIRAYEAQFGADWQNELVLVADAADSGNDFRPATDRLAALVAAPYAVADRLEVDEMGSEPVGDRLRDWLEAGAGFIHFTGHGGVENLGAGHLFTVPEVAALENAGRPPVLVALSCLLARFDEAGADSLGEALLRQPDGGAVAVLGPSGLSRNDPAADLGEAFYRAVLQKGAGTLGLAFLQARRELGGSDTTRETYAIYNLLGDPALRIAGNTEGGDPDAGFAEWRWQRYAPAELAADADALEADRFAEYAFGVDGGLTLGRPSPLQGGEGWRLTWKRRIYREDVDYQFFLTENLLEWQAVVSESLPSVKVEPDPDGVMETVCTRVDWTNALRLFMGVKAVRCQGRDD
ncbi:MAG TPA: C25 family cysteine peptidase [Kiritimatiellia bacterium]|nr:C25 family cysteine peptidase [Kiritimatiellia bacterium]